MAENRMLRILIIEDEPRDADLMKRELKQEGMSFEARVVDTREGMLAVLDGFRPDIILSDYTMPQFSGMEALEILNQQAPDIPFIIVTASINEKTAVECIKQGVDDYLTKDRLTRLYSSVINALEKKRLEQQEKEAQIAIRQSAAQWRTTFDSIQNLVAILDFDGNFIRCNKAMQAFIEKPWQEVIGQSCCNLIHGSDERPKNCPARRCIKSLKREAWQAKLKNRWFEIFVDPVIDDEGRLVQLLHVMTDITERYEAEQILRASEEKYRTLVSNIPGMVYHANPDWTVDEVTGSDMVCGYSPEEMKSDDILWQDIIHPENLAEIVKSSTPLSKASISLVQEYRIVDKNGEVRWVRDHKRSLFDGEGFFKGIDGVVFDITRQKEAARALFASEVRYRALFSGAVEGILVVAIEDQTFRYVNPALCKMLGYMENELVGLTLKDIHPKREMPKVMSHFESSIWGGKTRFTNIPCLRKDGKIIYVNINATTIQIDQRPCMVGFFTDITDLRQLEGEKKELEDQLRQSQKLEAIGRLAGGVAHDFNNIIHAIKGYAVLASRQINDSTKVQNHLNALSLQSDRAAHLVKQLLAFSRKQALKPEIVEIDEFLNEELKTLRRMLGEDILIQFNPNADSGCVLVDKGQLSQILINLAVNSRDAMPEGGQFSIRTDQIDFPEQIKADNAGVIPGRYLRIEVSDTGHGMDKETLEQIYEPFFTTKKSEIGTGLGLSTVHGIVKQHQGNILVESKPDKGTTFEILLPQIDSGKESPKEESTPLSKGNETILLVEDEEGVLQIVNLYLEELGYRVISAVDATEAETKAKKHSGPIQLLLTDVVMPDRNGVELYKTLLHYYPDLRVLYMSGYTAGVIERYGVLNGSVDLLLKPFAMEELASTLRSVIERPLKRNCDTGSFDNQ